ncbi:T-complex protein 11 X-linked protein 2-like [Otolemur garnettii]|uniref:T-complex protein 11 X-linked protein 2-like n=1 Tax=Otolemur garnettii TaxID=30611 RepID=UPI000643FB1F|nr:T-complex protein 11 X-linked protein 2-like [Otolemur garnettii]
MPKTEGTVLQNDPNEAKCGAHNSETSGKNEEEENFCLDNYSPHLMETIKEVSRVSIAHEIIVNQDFYMGENVLPPNSMEDRFMETLYNVFWNHQREQLLSNPPQFTYALELMTEVKEILLSLLLPRHIRLKNEMKVLDMDLLKQKAEHRALDVSRLSNYILSLMTLLCAPVRDEEVKKLQSITDPVQLLRGIFHVLGLMKMDTVNYTIQSIRPYLKEYSIQYERAKFQELLDKQSNLLDYTKKWLTQAATDLITPCLNPPDMSSSSSMACSSPNKAAENSDPPNPIMVLYQGYLNLLLWDPENEEFPKTLLMDRNRVQEMGSHLHHLAILASILLVARSFSGKILFNSPGFVDKLKGITKAVTEEFNSKPEEAMLHVSEQVSQEIHHGLEDLGFAALSSENTVCLIGQLQNITEKDNSVRSVIDQRLLLFLKCCLVRGMQASLQHFSEGLNHIKGELRGSLSS